MTEALVRDEIVLKYFNTKDTRNFNQTLSYSPRNVQPNNCFDATFSQLDLMKNQAGVNLENQAVNTGFC